MPDCFRIKVILLFTILAGRLPLWAAGEADAASKGVYCVIDVLGGPNAAYYPISFLESPPEGGWSDDCKLSKIVLRKVVPEASGTNAEQRLAPYYLGIFELTQSQYQLVTGKNPKSYLGRTRPVVDLLWSDFRGNSEVFNWPQNSDVDEVSFFGILRKKTGLKFDLPSVEQWRIAAELDVKDGKVRLRGNAAGLLKYERCQETSGDGRGGYFTLTTVGSYPPNQSGFYDLVGNASEWCLDGGALDSTCEKRRGRAVCGIGWRYRFLGHHLEDFLVRYRRADQPDEFDSNRHGARVCLPDAGCVRPSFHGHHPYCVVDLSKGLGPSTNVVSFLDAVPSSGWGMEYKTDKLLLRRIEPGTFRFQGRSEVEITRPFYIGVFEVTERQWERITGTRVSIYVPHDDAAVQGVSWEKIRANPDATGVHVNDYDWPTSRRVFADSFVGRLGRLTGFHFDLPTEVQWEYACKAGTTTRYNIGEEVFCEVDLHPFVRYFGCPAGGHSVTDLHVGLLRPNRWGLYDMLGNVAEYCRDRFAGPVLDMTGKNPVGALADHDCYRVIRGGSVRREAEQCTSNSREPYLEYEVSSDLMDVGFRVVMELERKE